jgi:NAD(P)H dehydrogenase (quinone)
VTDEQLAGGMKAAGVPEPFIPTLVSFDTATRAGNLAAITSDVETLSGKKPRSLKAYLEANKAAFLG